MCSAWLYASKVNDAKAWEYYERVKRDCAARLNQLDSPQMIDLTTLDALKERGVTKATFHPNGALESVEFSPVAPMTIPAGKPESPPEPTRRLSATGGLVPRGLSDPE